MTELAEKIKVWYERGNFWTKEKVRKAVEKGKITEDEYRYITGEDY